jgi:P27 family predicted phage terminase small subunit
MTRPTRSPAHLSPAGRKLFTSVMDAYILEPRHVAVLVKAIEAHDRAEQARTEIGAGPLMVASRLGELRPHPLLAVERDSRAQFGTLMKMLGLDIDGPPAPSTRNRR